MSEDKKKRVIQTFSKNKEAYVSSSTHNNKSDLNLIVDWLEPSQAWTVLDIATGGGHVAKSLCPFVETVFATDLTKDMLQNTAKHLRSFSNLQYVVADAEALPFLDNYFDAVTCRIAPHHFPSPESFISEVARVLKPGGSFLMIDNIAPEDEDLDNFYNTFEQMRDSSHVRALKVSEWELILKGANLTKEKDLIRKKTLPFQDWVKRTLDLEEDQSEVERYFLAADQKTANYFDIQLANEKVCSFSIDEWMCKSIKES